MKTPEEMARAFEQKWRRRGLSQQQIKAKKMFSRFVINPQAKTEVPVIKGSWLNNRSKVDDAVDEKLRRESLKEVWDE